MTLPLITYALLKKGYGEKSIGAVYASNTVGAIIGVFFAIHLGMPLLGLRNLIIFGACIDIGLGLFLLWKISPEHGGRRLPAFATVLCVCGIAVALLVMRVDTYKMASGVYRSGTLITPKDANLIYHKDGKTATVSVFQSKDGIMNIRTNGKIDASISENPIHLDHITTVLSGAIPLMINPKAGTAANRLWVGPDHSNPADFSRTGAG